MDNQANSKHFEISECIFHRHLTPQYLSAQAEALHQNRAEARLGKSTQMAGPSLKKPSEE